MITFRHATAAFLRNQGNVLLLKRGEHRKIAPGFWSGVGGHFKECEMDTPFEACYRDIEEETGISKSQIQSLDLCYILLRRSDDEIRHMYIFFGETTQTEVIQTDEGQLFWVPEGEWLDREYTGVFTLMLAHYLQRQPGDRRVYIGAVRKGDLDGALHVNWAVCEDFD
ncbi:MAG: NUDIX domain-containing protein [Defluviitaleaceae bacterium]|nr:NUDIX domain-containing protein [Defluviitaleaceae bacterium]